MNSNLRLRRSPPLRKIRGVALVLTIIAITLVAAITFGAFGIVTYSARGSRVQNQQETCYQGALCGLQLAGVNLPNLPNFGSTADAATDTTTPTSTPMSLVTINGTPVREAVIQLSPSPSATPTATVTVDVSVTLDTSAGTSSSVWYVTSRAHMDNAFGTTIYSRTLEAVMEAQTFAKFAICAGSNGTNTQMRFTNDQVVEGPVHNNGSFSFQGHPQFSDKVTSANEDEWPSDTVTPNGEHTSFATTGAAGFPFAPGATPPTYTYNDIPGWTGGSLSTTDTSLFYHAVDGNNNVVTDYTANGPVAESVSGTPSTSFSFHGGQPGVPIDESDGLFKIQFEAGSPTTAPTKEIYTAGNSMAIFPTNTSTPMNVVFNSSGTVVVAPMGGTPIATLTPGSNPCVLYVEGVDVHVSGTLKGQFTLGAGSNSGGIGGNIMIDGDVKEATPYASNPNTTDSIGLVAAGSIDIDAWTQAARDRAGRTTPSAVPMSPSGTSSVMVQTAIDTPAPTVSTSPALTIDGAMMAITGAIQITDYAGNNKTQGDTNFGVADEDYWRDIPAQGGLQINGSQISNEQNFKGRVNSSGLQAGYLGSYSYDPRFASDPPPFFPSTGQVVIRALKDDSAPNF